MTRFSNQQGPASPRRHCDHDSKRLDGYLDEHCLRCGMSGYWRRGKLVVEVDIHPSGKPLVKLGEGVSWLDDDRDEPVSSPQPRSEEAE
jgi:hypothetical protein